MAASTDSGKEIRAHLNSYNAFIGMMKWGTIASSIVAMLVIFIIAS